MSKGSDRLRDIHKIDKKVKGIKIFSDMKYRLILEGILVGLFVGAVVSAFRLVLSKADAFRNYFIQGAKSDFRFVLLSALILAIFTFIVIFVMKKEPVAAGSGIPQVKGEIEGRVKSNWLKVLVFKFFGTIAAIFGGLSVGHEGPSIQLGAMVGKGVSRLIGRYSEEEKYLIVCGAGAGIAAAFNAPIAGVVFVLEEFRRKFSHKALLSTMASSITADWVASSIFGLDPVFEVNLTGDAPGLGEFWLLILLGIILGVLAWFHNSLIDRLRTLNNKIAEPVRVGIAIVIIVVIAIIYPIALGSGHEIAGMVGRGNVGVKSLIILLIAKLLFSTYSSSLGAPGGVLLPLLILGAISGALFDEAFAPLLGYELAIGYYVIFGMAGLFASIVRAPITGILLICEMTGGLENLLPLAIVSLSGYVIAELLGAKPIYEKPYTNIPIYKNKSENKN